MAGLLGALLRLLGRRGDSAPAPAPTSDVIAPITGRGRLQLLNVDMKQLTTPHGAFDSTELWRLTPLGLEVGGKVRGTAGEPRTAMMAFEFFGVEFRAAARDFGVPVELLVACACAEAGVDIRRGKEAARLSERREPGFVSYAATPHRVSIGVMHTLLSTARAALGDPGLQAIDLCSPSTSIRAGAAYIAGPRPKTHYDPPLVGAAYNAGGVYDDPVAGLPFSLRDFPAGEDRHVERFCAYFNDVCRLVNEDPQRALGVPSFMRALS